MYNNANELVGSSLADWSVASMVVYKWSILVLLISMLLLQLQLLLIWCCCIICLGLLTKKKLQNNEKQQLVNSKELKSKEECVIIKHVIHAIITISSHFYNVFCGFIGLNTSSSSLSSSSASLSLFIVRLYVHLCFCFLVKVKWNINCLNIKLFVCLKCT